MCGDIFRLNYANINNLNKYAQGQLNFVFTDITQDPPVSDAFQFNVSPFRNFDDLVA